MSKSVFKRGVLGPGSSEGLDVRGELSHVGNRGQAFNIKSVSTVVSLVGATASGVGVRLAKKNMQGFSGRVTKAVVGSGVTGFNIGDGSDADRYGAAIALTEGTEFDYSSATADPREFPLTAGNVVFSAISGVFESGEISLEAFYFDLEAPSR